MPKQYEQVEYSFSIPVLQSIVTFFFRARNTQDRNIVSLPFQFD